MIREAGGVLPRHRGDSAIGLALSVIVLHCVLREGCGRQNARRRKAVWLRRRVADTVSRLLKKDLDRG